MAASVYPLAHAGLAVGLGHLADQRFRLPDRALVWLAVGALLPDLLDKAISVGLALGEGRLIGHTLVFACAWIVAGVAAYPDARIAWPQLVGFGSLSHVLADLPAVATSLWPAFGVAFPIRGVSYAPRSVVAGLLGDPVVLVAEIAGAAILAAVVADRRGWPSPPPGARDDPGRG